MSKKKKEAPINPLLALDYSKVPSTAIKDIIMGGNVSDGIFNTGISSLGTTSYDDVSQYGDLIKDSDNRITSSPEDWQDLAAINQGWTTQMAKGAGRFVGSTLMKTAQSAGLLGSGLITGLAEVGQGLSNLTSPEERQSNRDFFTFDNITNNSFVNGLFEVEESMKDSEALRIFKPTDWDDRTITEQLFSPYASAWLADEFADGAAFMASSMVQAYLTGGLGGAGAASRGLGLELSAASQTTAEGAMAMSSLAKVFDGAKNVVSQAKNVGGFLGKTALLSANEALFEARDTGQQVQSKYLQDLGYGNIATLDGESQKEFIATLPAEQQAELKEKKANAMHNTFLGNMSILMFSNAVELSAIQNLIGKSTKGLLGKSKEAINTEGNLLNDVLDASSTSKKFLGKGSRGRAILKSLGANVVAEGLFEENIQNAIQNISQTFDGGNYFSYMGDVLSEMAKNTFTGDKETWKSIVAGAAIGGPGGAVAGYKGWKEDKTRRQKVISSINSAKDNFKNLLGGQLYERDSTGNIVFEDGEPKLNQDKLVGFLANVRQASDLSELHDMYATANNQEVAGLLRNELMTKLALNYMEAGLGDELTARINNLGQISNEELEQAGIEPSSINPSSGSHIQMFKDIAENVKRDYKELSRQIPNAEENQLILNTAVKTSARLRALNDISSKLEADVQTLKVPKDPNRGNFVVNDINARTLKIKELQKSLNSLSEEEHPQTIELLNKIINRETEKLNEYKDISRDNLYETALIRIPNSLSYIRQESYNTVEKELLKEAVKKQASAEVAKYQTEENLNKLISNPEELRTRIAMSADVAAEENEKKSEIEGIVRTLQDGDAIEVTDLDGNKSVLEITSNPESGGLITKEGIPVNSENFADNYKSVTKLTGDEINELHEDQRTAFRNEQLKNRILKLERNIKGLRDRYFKSLNKLNQSQSSLDVLRERLKKSKNVVSQQILNNQINALEKTIDESAKEVNRLREVVSARFELIDELQQEIYDKSTETDITSLEQTVELLRDKVKENQELIDEEKGFLETLVEHYNQLKNTWKRLFPNKRKTFKDYSNAQDVLNELDNQLQEGIITEEEYYGIEEEQTKAVETGEKYSAAKEEVAESKEELKAQIKFVETLEKRQQSLQRKLEFYEKELKDYEAFLRNQNQKGRLHPEGATDAMPATPRKVVPRAIEGGFKKNINGGLLTTTGNSNNNTPAMNAWFKFTESTSDFKPYRLLAVTINHPIFGLGGANDVFSQEPKEYQNENNIKVVAIHESKGSNGQIIPVRMNDSLVSTSLIEYKEDGNYKLQDGTDMFINKDNLSEEQLAIQNQEYKNFIDKVKATEEGIVLDITGTSAGFIAYNPQQGPISGREAFGVNPKLNIATNESYNYKGLSYRTDIGAVFSYYKGQGVPATVRNLNNAEAIAILGLLKEYSKSRGTAKGIELLNRIKSVLFLNISSNPDNTTFFARGVESFVFGVNTISLQDLQDGKYDNEIIEHLENQRHQVNASNLNSTNPYTSIFGITYNDYNDYLVTNANGRPLSDIPVTFEIAPRSQSNSNNDRQFNGIYLSFNSTDSSDIVVRQEAQAKTNPNPPTRNNGNTTSSNGIVLDFDSEMGLSLEAATPVTLDNKTKLANGLTAAQNAQVQEMEDYDTILARIEAREKAEKESQKTKTDNYTKAIDAFNNSNIGDVFLMQTTAKAVKGENGQSAELSVSEEEVVRTDEGFTPVEDINKPKEARRRDLQRRNFSVQDLDNNNLEISFKYLRTIENESSDFDFESSFLAGGEVIDNPFGDLVEEDYGTTPLEPEIELSDNPEIVEDEIALFEGLGATRKDVPKEDMGETISKADKGISKFDFDREDSFLRADAVEEYKQGDLSKEVADLERLVGKEALDSIVRGLVRGVGFGLTTRDGKIILSDVLTEGTVYHEAFHRVFGNILTIDEQQFVLEDWRKNNPLRAEGKDNSQIEEILAEDFRDYMLSREKPQGLIGRLFDRIVQWFQSLFKIDSNALGLQARTKLFAKIAQGEYKNRESIRQVPSLKFQMENKQAGTISSVFGTATERALFEGMSYQLLNKIVKSGFNPSVIGFYTNGELADNDNTKIEGVLISALRDAAATIKANNTNPKTMEFLKFVASNSGQVLNDFKNYLKRFSLVTREDVEGQTELTEDNKAKDTLGILDTLEFDPKTGTPNTIKLMIASLPATRFVNGKFAIVNNMLGLPSAADYRSTMAILYNHMSRTDGSLEAMRNELNKLAIKRPEFKILRDMLKLSSSGQVKSNSITVSDHKLQTKFRETFDKSFYEFFTLKMNATDEGIDSYYVNSNADRAENIVQALWSNSFASLPNKVKKIINGQEVFNKEYFDKTYKLHQDNVLDFLKDIGIVFSNPNEINLDLVLDKAVAIKSKIDNVNNLFSDNAGMKGWLNSLIKEETRTSLNNGDNQHINPDGKSVYSVSLNNMLTIASRHINNGTATHLQWDEKTKTGNPLVRNSAFLRKKSEMSRGLNFHVSIIEGTSSDAENTSGQITSKLTATDKIILDMISVMQGKLPFLRQADRKVEYSITLADNNGNSIALSDLNLSNRNKATETFQGYLADELLSAYMLNVQGVGSDITYYNQSGKDLRIFDGIFGEKLIKEYKKIIEPRTNEDGVIVNGDRGSAIVQIDQFVQKEEVVEAISKLIDSKIDLVRNTLINKGIVRENSDGTFTNILLPKMFLAQNATVSLERLNDAIEAFAILDYISQVEQTKLYTGDVAFYKQKANKVDFFKRTSGLGGTGKTLDNSDEYLEAADRLTPRGDGRQHSKKINTWVLDDVVVTSSMYDSYKKALKDVFKYTEAEVNKMLSPYKGYDEADAQGYISIHSYRDMLLRAGQWLDAQEQIYQDKLIYGIPLSATESLTFPPLKPQYFGPQYYNELYVPTFYKLSLMPLIPSVLNSNNTLGTTNLDKLRKDMDANGIDLVTFLSGNKVGHRVNTQGSSAMYNENGDYNTGFKPVIELDWDYMKIQLDMSPEKHSRVSFGTQFRKLVLSNILTKKLYGKEEITKELLGKYNSLIEKLTELELEKLYKRFDVKENQDGTMSINRHKLSSVLRDDAFTTNAPKNVIDDINAILDNTDNLPEAMITRNRMEALLMGMVNNGVIRTKVFGDMLVQGSVAGIESDKRTKYVSVEDTKGESWASDIKTLKFYEYNEKGTKAMEVYLPHRFKELYGREVDFDSLDERLKEIIGFRIPTQGLNSIEVIKIKGFLPQEAGNLVIVPSEIVAKAGSDFDIDKLNIFLPYYKVRRNWKQLKADFLKRYPEFADYLNARKESTKTLEEKVRNEIPLNEYEELIYNKMKDHIQQVGNEYDTTIEYVDPTDNPETTEQVQNGIIRTAIDIISAPENFPELISPISAEVLEKESAYLGQVMKKNNPNAGSVTGLQDAVKRGRYLDFDYRQDTREAYLTGKEGVAIAALHLVHHTMAQQAGLRTKQTESDAVDNIIRDDSPYINLPHNIAEGGSIDLAGTKDVKGTNFISDMISAFLNGFVDIAKDPFLKSMNADSDTANTFLYLVRAGVPIRNITMFMNQPIILDYMNLMKINTSTAVKAADNGTFLTRKELEDKVRGNWSSTIILENEDYKSKISLTGLESMIGLDNSNQEINAVQQSIFNDYLHYANIAGELSNLMSSTNADTAGAGGSLYSARDYMERYNNALNSTIFENVQNFEKNTFLKAFNNVVQKSVDIYSPLFKILNSDTARQALDTIKQELKNSFLPKARVEQIIKSAESEYISYIMQNATINGIKVGERLNDLFKGPNSVARRVAYIKENYPQLANNLLIKELNVKLSSSQGDIQDAESFDRLSIFSKKLPTEIANDLTSAWEELFEYSHPSIVTLAKDLLDYSLIQSSLKRSNIEFLKYAPTRYTAEIFDGYIKMGDTELIQSDDFIDKFYRNNWSNPDLVKWTAESRYTMMGRINNVTFNTLTGLNELTTNRSARFVKTGNKRNGYKLWRKTNRVSDKGFNIFEEVSKLGNGKYFAEYSDATQVTSNIVNNVSEAIGTDDKPSISKDKTFKEKKKDVIDNVASSNLDNATKEKLMAQAYRARTEEHLAEINRQLC